MGAVGAVGAVDAVNMSHGLSRGPFTYVHTSHHPASHHQIGSQERKSAQNNAHFRYLVVFTL